VHLVGFTILKDTKILRKVCNYQTTMFNIPEDFNFQGHLCVNLKSRTILSSSSINNILNYIRCATLHACLHGTYHVYLLLHEHITVPTVGDVELPGTFMNIHYSNTVLIR
jgi:hypothetical protein